MEIQNESIETKEAGNENIGQSESKTTNKPSRWTLEKRSLVVLFVVFAVVLGGAWMFALKLQQTVAGNRTVTHADPSAMIEVERLRSLAASQLDNSRAFFLLGSQSLYDKQKNERVELLKSLTTFEQNYNLPRVPEEVKEIRDLVAKAQEFFDQGMEFREKKTESKIVGQFYQSKVNSIANELNKAFTEIAKIHQAKLDQTRDEYRNAAAGAETQIPKGMTWLTGLMFAIFAVLSLLIVRLVRKQEFQISQTNRLYAEAKKAVQDRDETLLAVSNDLKDSLSLISLTAERIKNGAAGLDLVESGQLVKSTVSTIEGRILDICERKHVEIDGITLRLDQLSIDQVLDNARLLMQPLAKQYDVRLQIDSVNPPVLAFYDNERILRVLANLINNAIKFSPKSGKVVVKVRSDQKFVNISVVDNGVGIPANQLDGIFDKFWQAKKTADQGPGLGLAIVKTIVEAHGGTVELQSQSGRGTTVTFSLPRRRPVGASLKKSAIIVRQNNPPVWT